MTNTVLIELAADVANWRDWPADALSDRVWRLYAADCAERALAQAEGNPHGDSVEAIRVARRYAEGEATREELAVAEAAAWDAAYAAGGAAYAAWEAEDATRTAAAWGAAYAVWDAADATRAELDTARAAAWGTAAWGTARAARTAAWGAARAAAWDAERSWQCRHLRRCLLSPTWPDWRDTV